MKRRLINRFICTPRTCIPYLAWAADTTRNEYTADQSMIEFDTLEQLHAHAKPFITWLQEAEEEGNDEDDDEDDDDDA